MNKTPKADTLFADRYIKGELTNLDYALYYATVKGWAVFPIQPRKKDKFFRYPEYKNPNTGSCYSWRYQATTDPERIKKFWTDHPAANIGIATGAISGGLYVLDFDREHVNTNKETGENVLISDGMERLKAWEAETGSRLQTDTVAVITGGGGMQLYYQADRAKLADSAGTADIFKDNSGCDTRGDGRYVVAPPSVHPSGRTYDFEIGCEPWELATGEADQAFYAYWKGAGSGAGAAAGKSGKRFERQRVVGAARHEYLKSYCGSMIAKNPHISDGELEALLRQQNESVCNPPIGTGADDRPDEFEKTVLPMIANIKRLHWANHFEEDQDRGPELEPSTRTDLGQAKVFAERYGPIARFSKATRWLVFDGIAWRESDLKAQGLAQQLTEEQLEQARDRLRKAREEMDEATESQDEARQKAAALQVKEAERYRNYVIKRQESRSISNCLKEACPALEIDTKDLDKDPFLLNTPEGTIDLRTGTIREHNALDYITKVTAASVSDQGRDLYLDFLDKVTCGDSDLARYLQDIAGMAAVGKVYTENLIIPYGPGGNGKSTLFNLWYKVLGDYAGTLSPDVLTANSRKNTGPELANLRGIRFALAAELEEGRRIDTALLKRICSTDPIHGEKKFKDPFAFIPSHTVVLYTNHLPKVGTVDSGTWRRLIVIPFNANFSGQKGEIKNYCDFLYERAAGAVLGWIVEGAARFIASGGQIEKPRAVVEALATYQAENDWLQNYIRDCCRLGADQVTGAAILYDNYTAYCRRNQEYTRSRADFKAALIKAGIVHKVVKTGRIYCGIGLRPIDFEAIEGAV